MVVTLASAHAASGYTQDRTAAPLTCTVHAPHAAMPQPNLVPVRPAFSRMAHSSGICGSASNAAGLPLRLRLTDIGRSLLGLAWRECCRAGVRHQLRHVPN